MHSCLCFSLLEKLFLKASSTPPQHLHNIWLFVELPSFFLSQSRHLLDTWWVNRESFCPFNSFSTPGGSIEPHFLCLMFCTSTLSRHLYLSMAKSSTPGSTPYSTLSRHLHLSTFTKVLYILLVRSEPHFSRSLSQ